MTVDEIKEKLRDRNIKLVAEIIGVHYNTLYKLVNGDGGINHNTYLKLVDYLKG